MKIYVASSWKNERQPEVVQALRALGHEVYDFKRPHGRETGFSWKEVDGGWETWDTASYAQALRHPASLEGFARDMTALKAADACVMVQPCGQSAGLELGYAIGAGQLTVVLLDVARGPDLMVLAADHMVTSLDGVLQAIAEYDSDEPVASEKSAPPRASTAAEPSAQ